MQVDSMLALAQAEEKLQGLDQLELEQRFAKAE